MNMKLEQKPCKLVWQNRENFVGGIGFEPRPGSPPCICAVSLNFPGTVHYPFECPIKHHQRHGRCAGWLASGLRAPWAWVGEDLTPATRAEWSRNIGNLRHIPASASGPDRVMF